MRLVAWNCGGGFHRKIDALMALAPDIAVIGECAQPELVAAKARDFAPADALWVGDNPHKGLAALAYGGYRLTRHRRYDPSITYALPVRVEGPCRFHLLALWSHHGRLPRKLATPGPTLQALAAYARFLRARPALAAGDLNNHIRWDRPGKAGNHANAVAALRRLGLVSAYHRFHGLAQGEERHPTLYWQSRAVDGPTYHIDYAFLPERAAAHLSALTVGSHADWVAPGLSDHVPLVLDLDPRFAQRDQDSISSPPPLRG